MQSAKRVGAGAAGRQIRTGRADPGQVRTVPGRMCAVAGDGTVLQGGWSSCETGNWEGNRQAPGQHVAWVVRCAYRVRLSSSSRAVTFAFFFPFPELLVELMDWVRLRGGWFVAAVEQVVGMGNGNVGDDVGDVALVERKPCAL